MLNGPYLSNAVLTPEQIHPNFFKANKKLPHVCTNRKRRKFTAQLSSLVQLSEYEIEHRKRWANRQFSMLANIPSTAVLGA
ncbi:hypothetical protein [Acinetobacter tianfuensis]|uniref:Uncharacterized protein n=1 Tax=Acinetobacter tianfuensis TaxID=2419603 RepID=A0A3A8EA03_9GAMM|nr:hypothetical protein [Acinetobacter tianfuensis]RKG30426.1 hypothetical protein D7V32_11225 [Acinetobacter tianfuensis]